MKSKTIKLFDFLTEAIKAGGWDIEVPQPETYYTWECPDGEKFSEGTKFSPESGKEVSKIEHTRDARYDNHTISDVIYGMQSDCPESFGYEYVDNVEKKSDDASGYHDHTIFKRKSDGKHFYFYSYDGRMDECDKLEETEKVVIESWDFEKSFM